jgi:hypothetical protein
MLTVLLPDASVQLPSTLVATLDKPPPLPKKFAAETLPVVVVNPASDVIGNKFTDIYDS